MGERMMEISPKHLEMLAELIADPKAGMEKLDFAILTAENFESKKRFMNVKHALEKYVLEIKQLESAEGVNNDK